MRNVTDSNAYLFEFGHVELVWNYRGNVNARNCPSYLFHA